MLQIKSIDFKNDEFEALVIPVCEDREIHDDPVIAAAAKKVRRLKEFSGRSDDEIILYAPEGFRAKRIIYRGLGKVKKVDAEVLRAMAGRAIKQCIRLNLSEVVYVLPSEAKIGMEKPQMLEALCEGALLGNHLFDKYKKEKKQKPLKRIIFHTDTRADRKLIRLMRRIELICQGTVLAREWVSMPSNEKRPEHFAGMIAAAARKEKLTVIQYDEKWLKRKKFGAMLAVAAGSRSKPRLVVLEYKPKGAVRSVAFVGKGVTFDSGGINLKPAASLDEMKMDMSGAAVVAAAMISIARLKPKINVIGAIPIVENMPSGDASRPGDIVRSYAGKTIEIGNTDAEGRLILIDAISYVLKHYKPRALIDLATLTGACVVALGEKIAGVFSRDDRLAELIVASGEKTHERCWRMPLPEDYKELLKSDIADINNMSQTRWGGAITAALFLSEFVGESRWAHIDIAGPAFAKKGNAYCGSGGTGFGVRLLCDLLEKL